MFFAARYGTSTTFEFPIVKRGAVDLAATADWTPATGDTKISKDSGNVANTTNNPSAVGGTGSVLWTLTLTTAEMQASRISIQIVDSATKAVEDQTIFIRTLPAPVYDALYGGNVNLIVSPQILSQISQAFDSDTTAHAVTMPATVHIGDLLIVVFGNDGSATVTTPTGWKQLSSDANSTIARLSTYCKIANGTEGGTTVDFVTSASEQASAIVIRIQVGTFFQSIETLGAVVGTAATGTSVSPDPPSKTIPWEAANSLVIACYGADDQAQATAYPASYQNGITKQGANAAGASVGVASRVIAAISEDPGVFTIASQEWIAQTIVIRPMRQGDNADTYQRRATAQTGASTSITLDTLASGSDDFYNDSLVVIIGGTGNGQCRIVNDYVGSTKVATVSRPWVTNPDSTSEFVIIPSGRWVPRL